jgi:hypothetical protein
MSCVIVAAAPSVVHKRCILTCSIFAMFYESQFSDPKAEHRADDSCMVDSSRVRF